MEHQNNSDDAKKGTFISLSICFIIVIFLAMGVVSMEKLFAQETIPMGMGAIGIQRYDLSVPGIKNGYNITEFTDRQGHHCVLVTSTRGYAKDFFQLQCH